MTRIRTPIEAPARDGPAGVYNPLAMRMFRLFLFVALAAGLGGCGLGQSLTVTGLQLGKSVNADATVASHTTRFAPGDTVYLAVLTTGAGKGSIKVRWKFGDRVVGEPTKAVAYRDTAATEFHLQSADGFPVGDYTVEAFLDDRSVGIRKFRVEK